MPAKREPETTTETESKGNQGLDATIGKHVILALGRPPKMLRVQVKLLWSAFYRVNVFVGGDNASATIANSYFVRASPEGQVLQAEPAITKQYELVKAGTAVVPSIEA